MANSQKKGRGGTREKRVLGIQREVVTPGTRQGQTTLKTKGTRPDKKWTATSKINCRRRQQ